MKISLFPYHEVHVIVYEAFWRVVVTAFAISWEWIDFMWSGRSDYSVGYMLLLNDELKLTE